MMGMADSRPVTVSRAGFWTMRRREAFYGILFAAPAILGFILFAFGPMLASFFISFTNWSLLSKAHWVGLENYRKLLTDDLIALSLKNTIEYSLMAIPSGLGASLFIALLLNHVRYGQRLFLSILYLPSIMPIVPVMMVWLWLLEPNFGLVNMALDKVGIAPLGWFSDPDMVLPSLVFMSLWGAGGGAVIFLASLRGIPQTLYDAAMVDGAGAWACFRSITLPMLSPVIFFNLVMGLIGALQTFAQSYLIGGGRYNSGLLYNLYLYQKAFSYGEMGYAAAMAWVLFVITMALTALVFRSSSLWVFYEGLRQE